MPDRSLRTPATWFVTGASRRLLLGSDAYRLVHEALAGRLAAVEAQKDLAASTDVDGWPADG